MFEKVNPSHPDKIADRIAGAMVDEAYRRSDRPKVAVEVLIGHGLCYVFNETDTPLDPEFVDSTVKKIGGDLTVTYHEYCQDKHLSANQKGEVRCGDNGIFLGLPTTEEEKHLGEIARSIYARFPHDGKYILDKERLVICQSNANTESLAELYPDAVINPLGQWTGGTDVDTGCTNRKLGSDMGHSITGGGLHGKDLSKADVTANIYAHLLAQKTNAPVELSCAIGDTEVGGHEFSKMVEQARRYIQARGGFERFAEWGFI